MALIGNAFPNPFGACRPETLVHAILTLIIEVLTPGRRGQSAPPAAESGKLSLRRRRPVALSRAANRQ
jgi:hypothetical protein